MHRNMEQKPYWYTMTLKILRLPQTKISILMGGGCLGQECNVAQF